MLVSLLLPRKRGRGRAVTRRRLLRWPLVRLREPAPAARIPAAPVPLFERPADVRRDRPRLPPHADCLPLPVQHLHQRRIARHAPRRLRAHPHDRERPPLVPYLLGRQLAVARQVPPSPHHPFELGGDPHVLAAGADRASGAPGEFDDALAKLGDGHVLILQGPGREKSPRDGSNGSHIADRPARCFLRPLAAIVADVRDLAATALSEPVHSWMGLRSRVLGQELAEERAGGQCGGSAARWSAHHVSAAKRGTPACSNGTRGLSAQPRSATWPTGIAATCSTVAPRPRPPARWSVARQPAWPAALAYR